MSKRRWSIAVIISLSILVSACAAQTVSRQPAHTATSTPSTTNFADTPTPDLGWVQLPSEKPAAILATVRGTAMYQQEVGLYGASQISRLDVPVLVLPYHAHTGMPYYDNAHFIIRAYDNANHVTGQFDYLYDRANHRIAFASFGANDTGEPDPYYARPFPSLVTESEAISALLTKRHITMQDGFMPELIFFPPDPRLGDTNVSPSLDWTGGGYDPALPMWLIQGADGIYYFVGIDKNVYTSNELPIDPHQGQQ